MSCGCYSDCSNCTATCTARYTTTTVNNTNFQTDSNKAYVFQTRAHIARMESLDAIPRIPPIVDRMPSIEVMARIVKRGRMNVWTGRNFKVTK